DESVEVDVWIASPWSGSEASERAAAAAQDLAALASHVIATPETSAARSGQSPDHDARFLGPMSGHEEFAARHALIGVDVNAPYERTEAMLSVARELVADQLSAGVEQTRIALYLAPGFVNLGI